ncbi:MAG TPA: S8 family peptidase, partial [Allosphingosinicella sp.]
ALAAYDAGATGAGVKVAVVDTGINPNLPEFTGRIDPASQDVAADRGIVDHQGHGSMVSGVIAANRDGIYMQGVAYEATILSLNVYDPAGCKPGNDCFLDAAIDDAIDLAVANGAKIINMSFGDEEGMPEETFAAVQRAVNAGIIVIMSAGNLPTPDPNSFAVKNVQQGGATGLFIIAGSIDANKSISSFSSRAGTGVSAAHYLTALGRDNATVNHLGAHVAVDGTSFSAPTIAGAAALLAGAFPNLTGAQIVQLLLTTADDAGAAGTDPIYGRGILNIAKAFQPQGATVLAGSMAAISLSDNGTVSGPMGDAAPGQSGGAIILDGYSRAYALDLARTLGRVSQEQPLAQGVSGGSFRTAAASSGRYSVAVTIRRNADGGPGVEMEQLHLDHEDGRRARAVAGMALSRLTPKTALAFGFSQSGHMLQQQLAGRWDNEFLVARDPASRAGFHQEADTSLGLRHDFGPLALTVTSERGKVHMPGLRHRLDRPSYTLDTLTFDRKIGPARFSLGASRLTEEATILGARFSSIFSNGGSRTLFADGTAGLDLGAGFEAYASYRRGWTSMPGTGSLVEKGRLRTEAFAFDLSRTGMFAAGDKLAFRVMQPLRVASGGFDLDMPVGYDYATGAARFERRFFNLAPTGREIDYEVAYGLGLLGGRLDFNAFLRTDPGHIETMKTDMGTAIRFTLGR